MFTKFEHQLQHGQYLSPSIYIDQGGGLAGKISTPL